MNLLAAAVLGVVQGVTEFLPVSSTAHLLLAERLLGRSDPGGVFTVTIQLGSILAVMWVYRGQLAMLLTGLFSDLDSRAFAIALTIAVIPALAAGALLAPWVKRVLYASPRVFAVAFIAGGIAMIVAERIRPVPTVLDAERTSWPRALGIGACQTLALIPGVSRSGATIVGGMMMGLDRPAAAEFSFFLAMPTMAAAFAHDLFGVRHQLTAALGMEISVGLVMAFISSLLVLRPFLYFVRRNGFVPFAWYRIALGGAILAALAAGWMQA